MIRIWLVAISLSLGCLANAFSDTITLAADYWMPYNGDGKTEIGYMLEIAQTVFKKAGHTVAFETVPWARAIGECRKGTYSGIIGAFRSDAEDFVYPANELGFGGNEFFVKSDSTWKYKGLASLSKIRLAAVKDYSYGAEIDGYVEKNKDDKSKINLSFGDNPGEASVKKLIDGKVDVFIEDGAVARYLINKLKLGKTVVSAGQSAEADNMYIAFSPASAKSTIYAKLLSDGVAAMRSSGELKKILAKYGLKDWK